MTSSNGAGTVPRWAIAVLLGILLFDVWWRGHTFGPDVLQATGLRLWPVVQGQSEPLDCDEAIYAYIGKRLAGGAVMYLDLTENKPPLGYWLYAWTVGLGGLNELTIRLMPLPFVLGTIALVWWIGFRLGGPAAGCVAAFLFVLLSTDPYLFGNGSNMEHAINLFATGSLAAMVAWWDRPRWQAATAAGALVAGAVLVKPVAAVHGLVYATAVVVRRGLSTRGRLTSLSALAAGFALPCFLVVAVLAARGSLGAAYDDAVRYGSALATQLPAEPNQPPSWVRWVVGNADPTGRLPWPFGTTEYLVWWGAGSWPLWMASVAALAWSAFGAPGPRRLVAAWTASAWIQVALPGLYWPHYYVLPTPGVALLVALLLRDAVQAAFRGKPARRVAGIGVALALVAAILGSGWIQVRDYVLVRPEDLTIRYKGGGQWVVLRELGRELGRRSSVWDDPRLHVWGIQSPLYVYSGLDGVTPQVFADNLIRDFAATDHPLIRPRIERTMRDLRERRPELIFAGYPPFPELRAFLRENYLPTRMEVAGRPLAMPGGMGLWVEPERYAAFERGP